MHDILKLEVPEISIPKIMTTIVTTIPIFLFLVVVTIIPSSTTPMEFNYPEIKPEHTELRLFGNATRLNSGIELTAIDKTDQIGQVRHKDLMQLWVNGPGGVDVADFTVEFSFTIVAERNPGGDGIAFFMAEPSYAIPNVTDGKAIGLVSHDELEASRKGFVAVEFDTFYNPEIDPRDVTGNHFGINVKSMVSRNSTAWPCNITSSSKDGQVYNAAIIYDSRSKNLQVGFSGCDMETNDDLFLRQNLSYRISLDDNLPGEVIVGFSAANGLFTSSHVLQSWSFNSTLQTQNTTMNPTDGSGSTSKTGLIVGISVGVSVLVLSVLGFIIAVSLKRRGKKEDDDDGDSIFEDAMDGDFEKGIGAKRFSYEELSAATNSFSDEEKLGQGGFGSVYKGVLRGSGTRVAIKKVSSVSRQGVREYAAEVKIISQLRHRNLVQLVGWCHRKKDLLLVYELMPNGSLDSHLFKKGIKSLLPWPVRYNIARGLASALLYLQEEWQHCVLHRDVKTSNVMLDSAFNTKLGDFGLARLVDHEKGWQTTALAGTLGYMAPESITTGRSSRESDVYSFGVVALEIACGRKAIDHRAPEEDQIGLVDWVWSLYGQEKILAAADPRLLSSSSSPEEEKGFEEDRMTRLMMVGLWCAHPDPGSRPSMRQVIHVLDFEASVPDHLPREMPVPTYLPRSELRMMRSSESSGVTDRSSSQFTVSSVETSSPSLALLSTHSFQNSR